MLNHQFDQSYPIFHTKQNYHQQNISSRQMHKKRSTLKKLSVVLMQLTQAIQQTFLYCIPFRPRLSYRSLIVLLPVKEGEKSFSRLTHYSNDTFLLLVFKGYTFLLQKCRHVKPYLLMQMRLVIITVLCHLAPRALENTTMKEEDKRLFGYNRERAKRFY